jgi:hypothetical protein
MRALNLRRSLFASIVLVALTTACSDTPTPTSPLVATAAPIVHATTLATIGDTTVQSFTVSSLWSDSYDIAGVHRVDIQAGSICDPLLTSYGPSEWDKPCVPLTRPIVFTAKSWTDENGHPQVTFSPDVRFVPGKVNTITLRDKASAAALSNASILWCPTGAASCVDEGANDASLATRLNASGTLSRRIKHFSGYTVIAD